MGADTSRNVELHIYKGKQKKVLYENTDTSQLRKSESRIFRQSHTVDTLYKMQIPLVMSHEQ